MGESRGDGRIHCAAPEIDDPDRPWARRAETDPAVGRGAPGETGPQAFLLITPDAIVRHLAGEIVERLTDAGLRIVRFRVHSRPPRHIELFHARNAYVVADAELHGMARQLMALGPSIALQLAGPSGRTSAEVIADLNALKGAGDPSYALPGTLRGDLRSINTMLNLVHTAGTTDELIRDCRVFFDEPEDERAGGVAGPGDDLPAVIKTLQSEVRREERDLAGVLSAVRPAVPEIDTYFADPPDPATAAAGLARVRTAGIRLDDWGWLVLRTSLRVSSRALTAGPHEGGRR